MLSSTFSRIIENLLLWFFRGRSAFASFSSSSSSFPLPLENANYACTPSSTVRLNAGWKDLCHPYVWYNITWNPASNILPRYLSGLNKISNYFFPLSNQLRVISKFQFQNFLINSKVFVTSLIKIGEKYLLNLFSEDDIKHARHVYDIYRSYQRYKIIPLLRIWTIYGLVARW